jgi:hypothetical protein
MSKLTRFEKMLDRIVITGASFNPKTAMFPATRTFWNSVKALFPVWISFSGPVKYIDSRYELYHMWVHMGNQSYGYRFVFQTWHSILKDEK